MLEPKFSINPTLEIDNSKDIHSLNSVLMDISKIGKNATITIINNSDISDKEKVLGLLEENNKLNEIINKIQSKLTELESKFNYSEYHESWNQDINFELEVAESGIDFRKIHKKDYKYPIYLVNKNDYLKFIKIAEKYNNQYLSIT